MGYHTRETNTVPCGYHELNPEMEALLAEYLKTGNARGFRKAASIFTIRLGTTFYPPWLIQAAQRRRQ